MYKRIFRSVCLTAFAVFIASLALIVGMLYQYFDGQLKEEIRTEANYLAHAVNISGEEYLTELNPGDKRITLIGADGTVLYDSEADPDTMDNHSQRDEVIAARKYGLGESVRYSDTLTEKTVYCAVRLDSGDILRVSDVQASTFTVLLSFAQPIFVVIIAVLILSAFAASRVSAGIVRPLNQMDLDSPSPVLEGYDELSPLFRRIEHQRATIEHQLEDAVKMREEFRMITENMSEGFLVIDRATNLLTYNTSALRLLGVKEGEVGRSVLELNRSEEFRGAIDEALAGGHAQRHMTIGGRTYSLIANPVHEGEEVIGAVIVLLDITEQEQREQLRREFTANVSHELKTPLTSISGFAELMKTGTVPQEDVVDFSARIYDEASRLIALVGDIIKLSELDEGGSFASAAEDVDLRALCEEIRDRLSPAAQARAVTFSVTGEEVRLHTSRKMLEEIIYNLCDNAVKYNRVGGKAEAVISRSEDQKVMLKIRDTGIGIPDEDQQRVFERFYRVDESHSREIGGTGLGLSIVKHGAAALGIEIRLESREGVGSFCDPDLPAGTDCVNSCFSFYRKQPSAGLNAGGCFYVSAYGGGGALIIRIKENPAADAPGCRVSVCPQTGQDMKKSGENLSGFFSLYVRDLAGLSSGIRTHGLYHPKVARYQSAPCPATARAIIAPVFRKCKGYFKFLSI